MKCLYLYFSNFTAKKTPKKQMNKQKKQKAIRSSSSCNLWPTPIFILLNIEFKILRKRPVKEGFRFVTPV